ncbi:MAG: hypothetical protein U1A78_25430 [Polyangia bacterium]
MIRRRFGLALSSCALLVGLLAGLSAPTLTGGAAGVPSAHAKAPAVASQADAPADASQSPAQSPSRRAPPTPCKTTKDCSKDHVCTKIGDEKVCTPTAIKPSVAPVVT